jgi:SP family general alpha glucoside:H+ symporter-like MFS transporter
MFPTPLAILVFFAPESPWWLVRKGRHEEAAKSIERLGTKGNVNSADSVAMMRRVIEMEKSVKSPTLLELFKGTDLRRTWIVAGVYLAQNLTGNLIANQAVYFFQRMYYSIREAPTIANLTQRLELETARLLPLVSSLLLYRWCLSWPHGFLQHISADAPSICGVHSRIRFS